MDNVNGKQDLIEFVNKIDYDIGTDTARNVDLQYQKIFDFLPELAMFVASYIVRRTFVRQTIPKGAVKDRICFFFVNMFDDDIQISGKGRTPKPMSYVHVFPVTLSRKSIFKKDAQIRTVSVIIGADHLKSFLRDDVSRFQFLFDNDNNFLIEEIMTDDILRTVNDIVKKEPPGALDDYYYRLKAMELLFYLFQSLSKRETSVHQKISESDMKAVYNVRNKLVSSLQIPSTIAELKKTAGMNELKMRKLFTQVFGMGIYDYYQHVRMKEAARLLRDEKLSVSEVGYQMGFENLSHFTKVFEKHIGKKPKKYSVELT